ncbi:MAG TPA: molecular chaperone HtpG [Gammaproteobacteria bacterium]|nr:molecular chaperone HtpG [Gammaproteobacteria bacterium]
MTIDSEPAKYSFQAEIKQLLHLMVHSLYSNREIFLRELISNASDANDKLRFEALAAPQLLDEQPELEITVTVDSQGGTISVGDNGIGMSADEIVRHLGTIAHSGTARFLDGLTGNARHDTQLIGQFGVGFYSAFIVAETVEVLSRRADLPVGEGVRWRSDGQGEFTVEKAAKADRGTLVTLKLRDDASEFLEPARIRELIHKYSDHIAFPVRLRASADAAQEADTVNEAKALWARPRSEISADEYVAFYKHIAHDFADPLTWSHNRVEGKREYTSLLYIPPTAPFDLWNREAPRGVKLYVQRVFINDEATQFLPLYLRFVRGIIDANDVALNVSRELLQKDPNVVAIKNALTKRVLDMLEKLAQDEPDKYASFWREFGAVFKEGLAEDPANHEKIAALLRFDSTRTTGLAQDRSLKDYVADAPSGQEHIYFLIGESPTALRGSPHLEGLGDRGTEVLLLSDRIDEWAMQYLREFEGKTFKDAARETQSAAPTAEVETGALETKAQKHLLKRVKRVLGDAVDEVRLSRRLRESPSCLVFKEHEMGFQMRELLKAAGHAVPAVAPSLELNESHPLVARLAVEQDQEDFSAIAKLLHEQALLLEGRALEDPAAFVRRINRLLAEAGPGSDDQTTA